RRRADEAEPGGLQSPRQLLAVLPIPVLPHELVERRSSLAQRDCGAGVGNRGLDLAAVPDDPRVAEQPLDVTLAEARDPFGIEAREGMPERLALAEDSDPREPRLKSLEAEALVETALVAHQPPPLLVVVGDIHGIARRPAADRFRHAARIVANDSAGKANVGSLPGLPRERISCIPVPRPREARPGKGRKRPVSANETGRG